MKKLFLAFSILLITCQSFAQSGGKFNHLFTLKGQLTDVHKDSVFIFYKNLDGNPVFQSQLIFNDKFIFSDSINNPQKARIVFKNRDDVPQVNAIDLPGKEIFIEHGLLNIMGNPNRLAEMQVAGSKTQNEADSLVAMIAPVRAEMAPLLYAYTKEQDPEKAAVMGTKLGPYQDRIKAISYKFFVDHPNSYFTADQMLYYVTQVSLDSARMIYKNFNNELKQSEDGKKVLSEIKKMEAALPGNPAADFTTTDIEGKQLSLKQYKGKYVLIDFWASWCPPCRAGNPHLVELYTKYKKWGLNVIGIASDDDTQPGWKEAIEKDHLGQWPNALCGAGTDNDIGDKYAIHFVPTRILINPDGKIIGRFGDNDSSDVTMNKMLASIFSDQKSIVALLISLS